MRVFEKVNFVKWLMAILVLELTLSGCFTFKSSSSPPLSRQDKSTVAALERQEASGRLTSTEMAMEKDSLTNGHGIRF